MTNPFSRGQQDPQSRARLDKLERDARARQEGDTVIDGGRRLVLRSPNGNYWAITVDNAGALSAVATAPP